MKRPSHIVTLVAGIAAGTLLAKAFAPTPPVPEPPVAPSVYGITRLVVDHDGETPFVRVMASGKGKSASAMILTYAQARKLAEAIGVITADGQIDTVEIP